MTISTDTNLSFNSNTTETLRGGTDYNITQTGSSDVNLNFTLPASIDNDTVQSGTQTINDSILNLKTLTAEPNSTVTFNDSILNNNGTINANDGSNITIDSKLLGGTGMTFISDSTVTMQGMVGGGQTVDVGTGGASN